MPVAIPEELIVAVPVALLLHRPPEVASDKLIVLPVHTDGLAGKIDPGAIFIVATVEVEQPARV